MPRLGQVPLGGTATGTGLNTHPEFAARVREHLSRDTGLTVSARRVLRLRLFRTTDADTPVSLRVTATGNASRGRKDKIEDIIPGDKAGDKAGDGTGDKGGDGH